MAAPNRTGIVTRSDGEIVATGVSEGDYLAQYAATFHEWVGGDVIKMTPVSLSHDRLTQYLLQLLNAYLALEPMGSVLSAPFVMRLPALDRVREPDVQVILSDNPGDLTPTAMIGPADICIEVVSPESVARDYGEKFKDYEAAGVREYWIIDPERQRADFNRLDDSGLFAAIAPGDSGIYHTPLLPRLALHVPTLWQDPLPDIVHTVQAVQAMLRAE